MINFGHTMSYILQNSTKKNNKELNLTLILQILHLAYKQKNCIDFIKKKYKMYINVMSKKK